MIRGANIPPVCHWILLRVTVALLIFFFIHEAAVMDLFCDDLWGFYILRNDLHCNVRCVLLWSPPMVKQGLET